MRSRTAVISLTLSLLSASIGAAGADEPNGDLASLVEMHLRWLGGREALTKLQNLTRTGTFESAGFAGRVVLRETRDGWTRQEREGGLVSRVSVLGAAGSWNVTISGQVETMSAHETDLQRRGTLRDFAEPLLEAGALSDLGTESRDGKRWRVVRIDYPDGDTYDLFLDPSDGACTWARATAGAKTHWVRFTDWRWVEGVRLPFDERGVYTDPKEDQTVRWASATANQGLLATTFERPLPRGEIVHFADGAASTAWLPLRFDHGFHMYVRGTVAGQPSDIMLDSGAQLTTLSQSLAKKVRLKQAGRVSLEGWYGTQSASLAAGVDVQIGTLALSDLTVLVTSLPGWIGKRGVIVGHELFNDAVVDIDYPGKRIAFHDPARYQPEPGAVRIPLLPGDGGDMLIEAGVEGLPAALFSIDTGAYDTVSLFGSFVEKNHLLETHSPLGHRRSSGVGGSRKSTIAALKSFNIGEFEWHDLRAEFEGAGEGGVSVRHNAGIIGARILKNFRVVLDRTNAIMYLTLGGTETSLPEGIAPAPRSPSSVGCPASTSSRRTGVHLGVQNTRSSRHSSESSEKKDGGRSKQR